MKTYIYIFIFIYLLLFFIVNCEHVQLNKICTSYPCLYLLLLLLLLYLNCGLVCFGFAFAIIVWLGASQKLCECRTVPLPKEGNTVFPFDRLPPLLQIQIRQVPGSYVCPDVSTISFGPFGQVQLTITPSHVPALLTGRSK